MLRHFQTIFSRIRRGKGKTDLLQLTIRIKYRRFSRNHFKSCKGINLFFPKILNLDKNDSYILALPQIKFMHSIIPNKLDEEFTKSVTLHKFPKLHDSDVT